MTGTIELEPERGQLAISFPYRPDLVEQVRNLPGRRWDKVGKLWRVPAEHVELVVETFLAHGFRIAPEVTSLLSDAKGRDSLTEVAKQKKAQAQASRKAAKAATQAPASVDAETLTVSGLNHQVLLALQKSLPAWLWVLGEVQSYDKNKHQKHVFFELVEKAGDDKGKSGDANVRARVTAVLFANTAERIQHKLMNAIEPFELRDGIEIRARVKIDLYVPRGQYQAIVEDVDPDFTLGKLELQRKQILAELERQGLHTRNVGLPWPELPLRVGLLTSSDSDAYNDFTNELRRSGFRFEVLHHAISVQGEGLERSLLQGLRWFAENPDRVDLLCIVRGGGARTDLAWFDNLKVAEAVARHPLKVVIGIGHQRDQSVLDLIAHSEKTPTAAAVALVQRVQQQSDRLELATQRLVTAARRAASEQRRSLDACARRAALAPRALLAQGLQRCAQLGRSLRGAAQRVLRNADAACRGVQAQLPVLCSARLRLAGERLQGRSSRLAALDPRNVLRRGFAMLRDEQGRLLTGVGRLGSGQRFLAELRDGKLEARVERVHPEVPGRGDGHGG